MLFTNSSHSSTRDARAFASTRRATCPGRARRSTRNTVLWCTRADATSSSACKLFSTRSTHPPHRSDRVRCRCSRRWWVHIARLRRRTREAGAVREGGSLSLTRRSRVDVHRGTSSFVCRRRHIGRCVCAMHASRDVLGQEVHAPGGRTSSVFRIRPSLHVRNRHQIDTNRHKRLHPNEWFHMLLDVFRQWSAFCVDRLGGTHTMWETTCPTSRHAGWG